MDTATIEIPPSIDVINDINNDLVKNTSQRATRATRSKIISTKTNSVTSTRNATRKKKAAEGKI